jgi:hypothetical protein
MTGTVERAFQLAPECQTLDELRRRLDREGFSGVEAYLKGSLRKELKGLLKPSE